MSGRIGGVLLAVLLGVVVLYMSRFWIFDLWPREGLFGLKALPPQGDLLERWLRGSWLAPFGLLLWAVLVFLFLSLVQRIVGLLRRGDDH